MTRCLASRQRFPGGLQSGAALLFGNEGADTISADDSTNVTVVGGNDSADGSDSVRGSAGADFIFGNGGNDTVDAGAGNDTLVLGFGNDCVNIDAGNNLVFANEGNDTVFAEGVVGPSTVFGGLGNDTIRLSLTTDATNRDSIQGNEGNDTIAGGHAIDTISGGSGNDVFSYTEPAVANDDGDNAVGGGPVEFITDVDWSVDRFDTEPNLTFATNTGAGTGVDLATSANNAVNAAAALGG